MTDRRGKSMRSGSSTGSLGGMTPAYMKYRDSVTQRKLEQKLELERKELAAKQKAAANRAKAKRIDKARRRKTAEQNMPSTIPDGLRTGDVVTTSRGMGIVRYIGPIEYAKDPTLQFVGVDLKGTKGKTDGTFKDKRYFHTAQNKKTGIWVKGVKKVVKPEDLLEKVAFSNSAKKKLASKVDKLELQVDMLRTQNTELQRRSSQRADAVENTALSLSAEEPKSVAFSPNATDKEKENEVVLDFSSVPDQNENNLGVDTGSDSKPKGTRQRSLFREKSDNFWEDEEAKGHEQAMTEQIAKLAKERALAALDFPAAYSPDVEIEEWITSRMQMYCKMSREAFVMPDMKDQKVKSALINVTRMLSTLTTGDIGSGSKMSPRTSLAIGKQQYLLSNSDSDTDSHSDEMSEDF